MTDDGQTRTGQVTFIASQAEFTPKNVQTRDERVKLVYKVKVGARERGRPLQARHARRGAPSRRPAGRDDDPGPGTTPSWSRRASVGATAPSSPLRR